MTSPAARKTLTVPPVENAPKILADARERMGKLLTHPKRFRELHGTTMLRTRDARLVQPRRPPRLEAVDLVAQAFFHLVDVQSWRVGTPNKRHFFPPGEDELVKLTGLSRSRQRRAIATGVAAGYWTFHQARHTYLKADGTEAHRADRAIYRLTEKLWARLGLLKRIKRQQELAADRARQARERRTAGPLLEARASLAKFRKRAAGDARRPPARKDDPEAEARRMNELMVELYQKFPDWPPDRVRAEARRLLKT